MIEQIIKNSWYGKEKLWRVFWLYKFIGGGVTTILVELAIHLESNLLLACCLALYFVFSIWVLKSVFACRFNSTYQKYLPKIIEIFIFINIFFLIFSIFVIFEKFLSYS